MGRVKIATRLLLKCIKKMMVTSATTILSSSSLNFRLSMARSINPERS